MSTSIPLDRFPRIKTETGERRYAIHGNLEYSTREPFRMRILDDIAGGGRTFVFDLANCPYIDSAGLGCLVSLSKKIIAAGGTLVLENLNDDLRLLLELTQLDRLFTVRVTPAVPS